MLFSLDIGLNQLIILAISFFGFYFTVDSFIEVAVKHILGRNIFYHSIILLVRIGIFNVIGYFVGLTVTISVITVIGVSLIIFLIEFLHDTRRKYKGSDSQ